MLENYLKVTFRNISRNAFFVLINIITLGLALAIYIVAYMNGKYDRDWDKMHLRGDEIYKVIFTREIQGRQNILISDRIASIYFGVKDPLGEVMSIFNDNGEEFTYTVGGVFEHLPLNSSFSFEVLTLAGMILALLFARFLVPTYSQMWEYMDLEYSLAGNPEIIGFLLVLLLFTTVFAGAYPSFYISRFNPVLIFQDKQYLGYDKDHIIGDEYFETMGFSLLEGRTFTREFEKTDNQNSIIVNQKFIADFGINDPIGKRVMMEDTIALYIIGVMADFYPYGFWDEIEPAAFLRDSDYRLRYLTIKTEIENLQEVNEYLEEKWKELIPSHPYGGFFQDSLMEEARQVNKNIKAIYVFLAIIALFLSAVGLYTLVSLSVIRRTKEVGVRKIVGAPIPRIIGMLSRSYLIIILVACIISLTGGHYSGMAIMKSIWDVHTEANIATFGLPAALILLVAFISIGWKVYRAASRNPTESLRYE